MMDAILYLKERYKRLNSYLGISIFPTRNKEKEQLKLLENIEKIISDMWAPDYATVLGGDYNLIIDGNVDYMGSNVPVKNKFNEHFEDFFD